MATIVAHYRVLVNSPPQRSLPTRGKLTGHPTRPVDRGQILEMAVTIAAPPHLAPASSEPAPARALAYMAQHFGFLETTEDRF